MGNDFVFLAMIKEYVPLNCFFWSRFKIILGTELLKD